MKKVRLGIGLGFLLFVHVASAQSTKDGVIAINDGKQVVYVKTASFVGSPKDVNSDGLVTIYSNLGTGDSVYNAVAGSGVLGKDAGQPWPQWVASSFIPKKNHLVTKISVGLTYVQGPNVFIMSLNEDKDGLPGKRLHKWQFSNVPTFGTCCALQTGKVKTGIPVKKGKMYWVVLRTTNDATESYGVSNNNIFDMQDRWDNNLGSGWINEGIQELGAFAVFGQ